MNSRFALVSMCGGKAERDLLKYNGNHGLRAILLADEILEKHREPGLKGLLITGVSYNQLKHLDKHMVSKGFKCLVPPGLQLERQPWRYTALTSVYVRNDLEIKQIQYDDEAEAGTVYRYVAFSLPQGKEIRVIHVPCCDPDKSNYDKQIERKRKMLEFEKKHEHQELSANKEIIVAGDWNTEIGNGECHELFDELPFEKLLREPTWNNSKIDNVLISPLMKNRVRAFTEEIRLGQYTDHKTVIVDILD